MSDLAANIAKLDAHRFSLHPRPIEATEELGELWREAMKPGIDLIISRY